MTIRAKLLPHNPDAAYLTSRGWRFPDGTFKPHYAPKPVAVVQRPSLLARWLAR